jgi:hypothetical protein
MGNGRLAAMALAQAQPEDADVGDDQVPPFVNDS